MKNTQKEILKLNNKKFDISTKTIKEKADIFAEYSYSSINGSIKSSTFPSYMTVADIVSFYEKGKNDLKDARLTKSIWKKFVYTNAWLFWRHFWRTIMWVS